MAFDVAEMLNKGDSGRRMPLNTDIDDMRRILSFLIIGLCCLGVATAFNFQNESLKYKVMFKWGLINKQAGDVVINLQNQDGVYHSDLAAKSASWADKFYRVRDTLKCDIQIEGFLPLRYEKIAHEDKDFKHDVVTYSRDAVNTYAHCTRYETRNGKVRKDEQRDLEAVGTTVDMLSVFYYMRNLDYPNWENGHVITINIFSGKRKELLTIKYLGIETVKSDDVKYEAYKISFTFTSEGGKKTSDDMWAWIDTTTRIPVKLEGKLPVGSVKCFYVP